MTQQKLFGIEIKDESANIDETQLKKIPERKPLNNFADEKGKFILNGVEISYEFKNDYFSKTPEPLGCPHIEFNSGKNPNLITETGYRSYFFNAEELEGYNSILDFIKDYCEYSVSQIKVGRKEKKPICDFRAITTKNEEIVNTEKIPTIDVNKDLCSCGKPKVWDCKKSDLCEDCLKKYFQEEFKNNGGNQDGLNEFGYNLFQDKTGYHFYSHTTGYEFAFKKNILGVGYCLMATAMFPYAIYICDEFGLYKNTLGITKEFADKLIEDLKLVKTLDGTEEQRKANGIEMHTKWLNPLIKQDEEGKKKAEQDKQIKEQSEILKKLLNKKYGFEVTIKVEKKQ